MNQGSNRDRYGGYVLCVPSVPLAELEREELRIHVEVKKRRLWIKQLNSEIDDWMSKLDDVQKEQKRLEDEIPRTPRNIIRPHPVYGYSNAHISSGRKPLQPIAVERSVSTSTPCPLCSGISRKPCPGPGPPTPCPLP
ncbi:hypothetical protein HDU67_006497 [Dinochytrium kinnereticum]|nr:hypothetical protein HDU67_006497 [Dinochytrium kinnereticum]